MGLKEKAKQLKMGIPAVFIAMKKKETPTIAKILAGLTIAYALSPIDLIPDFIPVLGYLDDALLLPALIALTVKLIPEKVFAECREQAEGLWQNGLPKKWLFALPVLLLYGLFIFFIAKWIGYGRRHYR
jgi:uncharacterized membrane protein YkvA (DUF1232 family)